MKYLLKSGRQGNLMTCFSNYVPGSINKTQEKWKRGCILSFLKNGDLGIMKNYRRIALTAIAAKVYNAMLLNCMQQKKWRKFWGWIRVVFREINPWLNRFYLLNHRRISCKNTCGNNSVHRFPQSISFFIERRWSKYN